MALRDEATSSIFNAESTRRVWCQSPLAHYTLETQRYVQPARCIPLCRPGRDIIVLPGNHEPTKQAWELYRDVLGLSDDDVVWTSGSKYNMDDDMDALTLHELKRRIRSKTDELADDHWLLVPYAPQPNFFRWARPLLIELGDSASWFGETTDWLAKYGDKGLLHRHMDSLDTPSVIETIDNTICVPRGFVCETTEHLLAARELLGDTEVIIKPLSGATGVGIELCPTRDRLENYTFSMGAVNLEEMLELDLDPSGEAISPAIHYIGNEFVGDYMLDQIMSGCEYTGWQRTTVNKEFAQEATRSMRTFLQVAQPTGAGGCDFLSAGGMPFLTDMNTGRFNGAHAPRQFFEMYAPPGSEFYCSKKVMAANINMSQCWELLKQTGLAFVPGQSTMGVFPILFLHGLKVQMLVIGETVAVIQDLWIRAQLVLDVDSELLCAADTRDHAGALADCSEICAICLCPPEQPVELGCAHAFCGRCLMTAHESNHNRCPVCRHEHMLDPIALRDNMQAYRAAYSNWRKGGTKGAHGEPDIISKVPLDVDNLGPDLEQLISGEAKKKV